MYKLNFKASLTKQLMNPRVRTVSGSSFDGEKQLFNIWPKDKSGPQIAAKGNQGMKVQDPGERDIAQVGK